MRIVAPLLLAAMLLASVSLPAAAQDAPLSDFWKACRNGDVEAVRKFLDQGMSLNVRFEGGTTPLVAAAMRGQVEVVKLLVERGADPNLRDDTFKITPLGMAVFFGQSGVAEVLLPRATADLDLVLRMGAGRGLVSFVEAGLKGNPGPLDLTHAWVMAKSRNHTAVLALLEKAGAQPPAVLSPADLERFIGSYVDSTQLEMEVVIRDGKLIGTGGDGFGSFFEEELVPLSGSVVFLRVAPTTTFHFEGAGKRFAAVTLKAPGVNFTLQRVGREAK